MDNIGILLERLPPPQLPDSISEEDRQIVLLAFASAKQQIQPYNGHFDAPWLLTPFSSDVWETSNRGREELVDGQWQNTVRFDWRVLLPNGALLTDACSEHLLALAKQIAFLSRSGLVTGSAVAPQTWLVTIEHLVRFLRWTVLNEQRFQPQSYGLQLIDQPALDWLFNLLAKGGWSHALQIPHRLISAIYMGAHRTDCPKELLDNPYTIRTEEIEPLVQWLESENCYGKLKEGAHHGKQYLRREILSKWINESPQGLIGANVSRFIRQFEPDFRSLRLHIRLKQATEFPSHKVVESLNESNICAAANGSILSTASMIGMVLDAYRHLPTHLPEPAKISVRRALKIANPISRPSEHTLFMPIDTGLAYLNVAMRFVHLYGEPIVGLYLAVMTDGKDYDPGNLNVRLTRSLKRHKSDWQIASGEQLANILNITQFRQEKGKPDFNRLRSNPTLDEALRVLIGSCIVCMALLKPSREEELTHLKRSCLRNDSGGYWFNFKLGKSNTGEVWQDKERPIPVIVAKAIQLLQRLGGSLSILFEENRKIGDTLFYLPRYSGFGSLTVNNSLLNRHLDMFCDFVGLPPDSEGRRWYVRIHEMRKWFLLLLFWSGRFDVLDAARWIAGHTDAEHVYAYIEQEFPGEELPQLEAEYAIDRIYRHDQERKHAFGRIANPDGLDTLYQTVLRHFNAESLTMIPEAEWAGYVQSLRKSEQFHLEPHSIFGDDGYEVVGINVSFVMREAS